MCPRCGLITFTRSLPARRYLEAYSYYDSDWQTRQLTYAALIWVKYRKPVKSILFLMTDHGVPRNVEGDIAVQAGNLGLNLQVQVVKLWEVPAADLLSARASELLPWVPLSNAVPADIAAAAQEIVERRDEGLRARLVLFYRLRYSETEGLEAMIETMFPKELEECRVFVRKIENDGARRVLRRVILIRFSSVPSAIEDRLQEASVDQIEEWTDIAATAASLDELTAAICRDN